MTTKDDFARLPADPAQAVADVAERLRKAVLEEGYKTDEAASAVLEHIIGHWPFHQQREAMTRSRDISLLEAMELSKKAHAGRGTAKDKKRWEKLLAMASDLTDFIEERLTAH